MGGLEDYVVAHVIGEGSFGKVYQARRKGTGHIVAMKFIDKRGKSPTALKNLKREIEIMAKINHGRIVRLLDWWESRVDIVVVMEFAEGELFEVLAQDGAFPEEEIQSIAAQLVDAIGYLHSNHIIHRDLKPQNILICDRGVIKLADFGFARQLAPDSLVAQSIKGTPLYMAPEIINERPYTSSADIWSLGCILYELAVGEPPFFTENLFTLISQITHEPVAFPPTMSEALKSLLSGMLQKSPEQRFSISHLVRHPFIATASPPMPQPLPAHWTIPPAVASIEKKLQTAAASTAVSSSGGVLIPKKTQGLSNNVVGGDQELDGESVSGGGPGSAAGEASTAAADSFLHSYHHHQPQVDQGQEHHHQQSPPQHSLALKVPECLRKRSPVPSASSGDVLVPIAASSSVPNETPGMQGGSDDADGEGVWATLRELQASKEVEASAWLAALDAANMALKNNKDLRVPLDLAVPFSIGLSSLDRAVRAKTCSVIGNACRRSDSFYPALGSTGLLQALITRVDDPEPAVRRAAAFACGNAAFHSDVLYGALAEAIPGLIRALGANFEDRTRANAAGALGNFVRKNGLLAGPLSRNGAVQALVAVAKEAIGAETALAAESALFALGNFCAHEALQREIMACGVESLVDALVNSSNPVVSQYVVRIKRKLSLP